MKILCSGLVWILAILSARADFSESVLTELSGVGLEVRDLNVQSDVFDIDEESIEEFVLEKMKEYDVRLLNSIELDVMPGQPFLDVVVEIAHAQGPSHLYSVELELREMAQLERPKSSIVSVSLCTWERKTMGIANRPEAIYDAIDRLMQLFSDELRSANP